MLILLCIVVALLDLIFLIRRQSQRNAEYERVIDRLNSYLV